MQSFNIDNKVKDREIIRIAIEKVCKSKKNKNKKKNRIDKKYKLAQEILRDVDKYVEDILEKITNFEIVMKASETGKSVDAQIQEKAYKPRKCKPFIIIDGPSKKVRPITSAPLYPDQIIHQIIIEASNPVFMKSAYEYSCGSIKGRGLHKGVRYMKKIINRHKEHDKSAIKYGAQLDITKCYPSISHSHLKNSLKKKFRGRLFLWLSYAVIDSYYDREIDGEMYGLAIGYSTSQGFCNFYLTPLDHFIKEQLGIRYYLRYMDDKIMFERNKKKLHHAVRKITEFLKSIKLIIKETWQIFRFDYIDKKGKRRGRAFDTLGLRFFRDKVILRKRLALSIMRQARKISKTIKVTCHLAQSFMSRIGWLRHCNSYNFYHKHVKPYVNIRKLKEVIRYESRKHCKTTAII